MGRRYYKERFGGAVGTATGRPAKRKRHSIKNKANLKKATYVLNKTLRNPRAYSLMVALQTSLIELTVLDWPRGGKKRILETNRRHAAMPKIGVTKTELIWPGKYDEGGTLKEVPRVKFPFQIIETVNTSRAAREAKKGDLRESLSDMYDGNAGDTFEAGWRNRLI